MCAAGKWKCPSVDSSPGEQPYLPWPVPEQRPEPHQVSSQTGEH